MSNPKTTQTAKADEVSSKSCFVIMPFGGWFDTYYEQIYAEAIRAAGLVPRRADDIYRAGTIVNDIWELTRSATIILADLTERNPNVMYELGLAHALAKPAILLTESIDDVPFDLRALRMIHFDKNAPDWGVSLAQKITKAIQEVIAAPLRSVLPAFLEVRAGAHPPQVSAHDKELLEIRQELEILRQGLNRSPDYYQRNQEPPPLKARIAEMLKAGVAPKAIAMDLGVSPSYVYQVKQLFFG